MNIFIPAVFFREATLPGTPRQGYVAVTSPAGNLKLPF